MAEKIGFPADDPSVESIVVNVTVEESNDFRSYHANGAMGGINQLGEMYIGFFAERATRLTKVDMRVFRDGRSEIIPETRDVEPGITRELQAGIFMNPHVAYEVAHFILRNLDSNGFLLPAPSDASENPEPQQQESE